MCGIAGIISSEGRTSLLPDLQRMTDAIAHRGPDGEGQWANEEGTAALGHRRLSIIDLSEAASQPMHAGRYTIVFNGEIYNYIELRETLREAGYPFQTASDTEVLLALFDQQKEKCLEMLDGMFAFAIWDNLEKQLFCARDRFGEKPFLFTFHEGAFYFASEMKALWAAGIPKKPCKKRIFTYLAYGRLDHETTHATTFFENIRQLEPASFFYVKDGRITTGNHYWKIDLSKKNKTITFEEASEKMVGLLEKSIQRRLRSDVPVGSSLSGGLDSSSIVMLIDRMKTGEQVQKTFSARFEGFARDEGKFIELVTSKTNTEPHAVFLTPESLMADMEKVAYHQEEPFGSTSIMAQWNVMKLAREHETTVLLDGQGADECLAGYLPFFSAYFAGERLRNKRNYRKLARAYQAFYGIPFDAGRFFFIHARFPDLRNTVRKIRNKLRPPAYLKQFHPSMIANLGKVEFESSSVNNLDESLLESLQGSSLPTLLRYADRNSMAHSREVRLPFLSHELVEFVFSLPDDFRIRDCWTKAVLRFGMQDILPPEICWRKEKIGFEPPNNRTVDQQQLDKAITILVNHEILHLDTILPEKSWEYVQVSKLFE